MKNNTLFMVAIISALLGLFIGYAIWGNRATESVMKMNMGMSPNSGGHMMLDGTAMGGAGKSLPSLNP